MEPVSLKDVVRIDLSADEIKKVMEKVSDKRHIAKMDNLRNRHPNVQFDCLLRGYIGEYAIKKWLYVNGIEILTSNYLDNNSNIDIDFLYKGRNLELKTSLIPDADKTLKAVIQRRDIKLIRRGNQPIEELKGDIHLQIYYNQKREAKDKWLKSIPIDFKDFSIGYLYNHFLCKTYEKGVFFVAWKDKIGLVDTLNNTPTAFRCWSFPGAHRQFWSCKIRTARRPAELIPYLKEL